MAIQKEEVSIDVQDIIDLLHSGYTWYKKEDLGYGSIQEKYNALDMHIKVIQKHPELQNVDTIARVFVITNNKSNASRETTSTIGKSSFTETLEQVSDRNDNRSNISETVPANDGDSFTNVPENSEELSAFANL
jgi:hypothetical protein